MELHVLAAPWTSSAPSGTSRCDLPANSTSGRFSRTLCLVTLGGHGFDRNGSYVLMHGVLNIVDSVLSSLQQVSPPSSPCWGDAWRLMKMVVGDSLRRLRVRRPGLP